MALEVHLGLPDSHQWQALLKRLPGASIYHSPEFLHTLSTAEIRTHLFHATRNEELCGLALIIEDQLLPLPLFGSKGFCPADILAEDDGVAQALIEAIDQKLAWRMLYLELFGPERSLEGGGKGFRLDGHRNYHLDLRQGHAGLQKNYSRSMRRNISRANQCGLRLRCLKHEDELERVHELLLATSRRVGAPALPRVLLKAVYRELVSRKMAKIYLAETGSAVRPKVINARIELIYKGYVIDWYTGDDPDYRDSQAGPWLVDQILKAQCEADCHTFDFGGAGREGQVYGPAEFKRRFGGHEVRVIRRMRVWHPILLAIAKRGYGVIQNMSRRGK